MRTTTRRPLIAASIALGVISTSLALASPALAASESVTSVPAQPAATQTGEQLLSCAGGFSFRVTWEPVEDASLYRLVYVYEMTDGTRRTISEYTGMHTTTYGIANVDPGAEAATTATLFAIGAQGESEGTAIELVSASACSGDTVAGQLVACDDDPDLDPTTSGTECLYRLSSGELYIDYIAGEIPDPVEDAPQIHPAIVALAGLFLLNLLLLPIKLFVVSAAAYLALVIVVFARHRARVNEVNG